MVSSVLYSELCLADPTEPVDDEDLVAAFLSQGWL